jgi:hypothetical protein
VRRYAAWLRFVIRESRIATKPDSFFGNMLKSSSEVYRYCGVRFDSLTAPDDVTISTFSVRFSRGCCSQISALHLGLRFRGAHAPSRVLFGASPNSLSPQICFGAGERRLPTHRKASIALTVPTREGGDVTGLVGHPVCSFRRRDLVRVRR